MTMGIQLPDVLPAAVLRKSLQPGRSHGRASASRSRVTRSSLSGSGDSRPSLPGVGPARQSGLCVDGEQVPAADVEGGGAREGVVCGFSLARDLHTKHANVRASEHCEALPQHLLGSGVAGASVPPEELDAPLDRTSRRQRGGPCDRLVGQDAVESVPHEPRLLVGIVVVTVRCTVVANDTRRVDDEHLGRRGGAELSRDGLVRVLEVVTAHLSGGQPGQHGLDGVLGLQLVVVAHDLDELDVPAGIVGGKGLDAVMPREGVGAPVRGEHDDRGGVLQ